MNPALLVAAALLLPKLIGTKRAVNRLTFDPIGVKKKDGKLNLIMNVTNPTQTSVSVDSLFLSFFIDVGDGKNKIGAINMPRDKAFKIAKQDTTTLYLPITLGAFGLVKLAAEILKLVKKKGAGFKPSVRVVGTVVSLGITQTIDEEIPLDVL